MVSRGSLERRKDTRSVGIFKTNHELAPTHTKPSEKSDVSFIVKREGGGGGA
jgi:hypothetical protein